MTRRSGGPFLSLSLATLDEKIPEGSAWTCEAKLDGYRIEAVRTASGKVTLYTRNAHDWTARFPTIAEALAAWSMPAMTLDGEVIARVPSGVSAFQALQEAIGPRSKSPRAQPSTLPLRFVVFDLLTLDGQDVRGLALRDRQTLLREVLKQRPARSPIMPVRRFASRRTALEAACDAGLEGVVCKRLDAPYVAGRHRQWIKVKCGNRQEFVVVGFTEPRGARTALGALLLGVYDARGSLHFAGKVGSGFNRLELASLKKQLSALEQRSTALTDTTLAPRGDVHWVKPQLVAEISFTEWTREGLLRHPVYHGLRADKVARAVRRERPA